MKFTISTLCFFILLGCSGEGVSEEKTLNKSANKEPTMLGLFGKKETEKYVISSPLEGVLMKDGVPLANTKIIRRLTWNGNEEGKTDEFMTDEKGYFSIPAHEEQLTLGKLVQFVSNIELFSESEKDENFFWYSNKFSGEVFSDFEKPLQALVCDINEKEDRVDLVHGAIYSKCRWDNI